MPNDPIDQTSEDIITGAGFADGVLTLRRADASKLEVSVVSLAESFHIEPCTYAAARRTDAISGSQSFLTPNFASANPSGVFYSNAGSVVELVYPVPALRGGQWHINVLHRKGPNIGIYDIDASADDGETWADVWEVDGYAASAVNVLAKSDIVGAGIIPAGTTLLRVNMPTKNAASSGLNWQLTLLTGAWNNEVA